MREIFETKMLDQLILVDRKDNPLGFEDKEKCHDGEGILHRAFSIFIFNNEKELLIQQRSELKRLWPLYWSNTCCSHPRQNETIEESTKRRLEEELGISCDLKYLYKFQYQANYGDEGSENELCSVLIGKLKRKVVKPNPEEINDIKWIGINDLEKDIRNNPQNYTPWFKMECERLYSEYSIKIESLFI